MAPKFVRRAPKFKRRRRVIAGRGRLSDSTRALSPTEVQGPVPFFDRPQVSQPAQVTWQGGV